MTRAELISELEASANGGRELTEKLAIHVGWYRSNIGNENCWKHKDHGERAFATIPPYTTKIDTALKLIPVKRQWRINGIGDREQFIAHIEILMRGSWRSFEGRSPSAPVAMCIAALKSMEAKL